MHLPDYNVFRASMQCTTIAALIVILIRNTVQYCPVYQPARGMRAELVPYASFTFASIINVQIPLQVDFGR